VWLVIVALITWSLGAGYYPGEVHGIAPVASYAISDIQRTIRATRLDNPS
jgi:hypothetical protein